MIRLPSYVLITPARNEAQFIGETLRAVVAQKVQPSRWIIVSDGSTDGTDDIVRDYAARYPWIEPIRMPERRERHFAGKVHAFNAGYARLQNVAYDFIGNLDSDVSFDNDYFAFLLDKLCQDPKLGLVGTAFRDSSGSTYDYRFVSIEHVTGTCQLFRRECFEAIGGYVPSKAGAVDSIAVIRAKMQGWKTRTFTEKVLLHYRDFGTAEQSVLTARFKNGVKDYAVGNHPIWELFRVIYQLTRPPYVLGSLMLAAGYLYAAVRRIERPVSANVVAFQRKEQMKRLKTFLIHWSTALWN